MLVIGQNGASEEDVARRNFVGDAGHRVQGFLHKCGITRSYTMVNAFAYSVSGQFDAELRRIAEQPALLAYRNAVLDWVRDHNALEAIIAFGQAAAHAVDTWPGAPGSVFLARPMHPSARPTASLLASWRFWLPRVRARVTPDPDGDASTPGYGNTFRLDELPPIPRRDLPFGMPAWFGQQAPNTTTRQGSRVIHWEAPPGAVG